MLWLLILLPLVSWLAEFLPARGGAHRGYAGLPALAGCVLAFAGAVALVPALWRGEAVAGATLRLDFLGCVVVLLASGLGAVTIAFARRHLATAGAMLFGSMGLFVSAAIWTALTDQLIFLFVALEATTLTTVLPVAFRRTSAAWEATYKYLLLNTLGLSAGLLGLVLLYAAASPALGGAALSISALAAGGVQMPPRLAAVAGALVITGFGTKAALVPLHAWLPDAYQEAPGGFSALFAGVGTKLALVAMARVLPPLVGAAPSLGTALAVLASLSMVVGVALTFVQDDLQRLLGYSSVSQMGYIALAVAVGGSAGYGAAAYHMLSHGLLKSLLFLCAAALCETAGTLRLSELRERRRNGPVRTLFLLAALGLGGMPPLPAFWSKLQIFAAAARGGLGWAAGVAVFTSLLTLVTMIRTYNQAFGGEGDAAEAPTAGSAWLLGLVAGAAVLAGLVPGWITAMGG